MTEPSTKIAIIGMAGRFPGASSVDELWTKVASTGTEAISRFEMPNGGIVGYGLVNDPAVFDNEFFDMSPNEARSVTPEHRLFLEHVWSALENAGIDVTTYDGFVSVYGSASNHPASYLRRILNTVDSEQLAGVFGVLLGNAMDSLATRVGYKLGLRGECITVQTHCSSSLVAVHLACQSLLTGHSDIAVAGGVSVRGSIEEDQDAEFAQVTAQEGFILSPEGSCLALLEGASGTISGDGVGVVVMKRLDDAIEDGDNIHAVIVGTGINNDGRRKVGFTAPSVTGVADAIEDALAFADLEPDDIGFIECHGTGTDLGDAIELRALRQVFETNTRGTDNPLNLGSVKANIGHLAAGSGVTGLIKAALTVQRAGIPPLLRANEHEPHSQVRESPVLRLPTALQDWQPDGGRLRRAGVSSLGIGGTNVHVVVEEPPMRSEQRSEAPPASLLVWSSKKSQSAEALSRSLEAMLFLDPSIYLPDVAHTLQHGRAKLEHRRILAATDREGAIEAFRNGRTKSLPQAARGGVHKIAFLFSGYGAQRPGMAAHLWALSDAFGDTIARCDSKVLSLAGFSLADYLRDPSFDASELSTGALQVAVAAFEIALAAAFDEWGVVADAVIGSSLGEYAAAQVAGALSLEDALRLVYRRGQLLDSIKGGAMLLLEGSHRGLIDSGLIDSSVELAIDVSPEYAVVSGPAAKIAELEAALQEQGVYNKRMPVEIAAHSAACERIRDAYAADLAGLVLKDPRIPYVSNATGSAMTASELGDPEYWQRQMRGTVRFREGLNALVDAGVRCFIEVGPGLGLTKFVGWNFSDRDDVVACASLSHEKSDIPDAASTLEAVGQAWLFGRDIDWEALKGSGRTIELPSYAFRGRRFYLGEELPVAQESDSEGETDGRDASRERPRNELEERIAAIWADILGATDIGIDENFFDLGGDSLQATRVLGRLQSEISSDVSVEDVMEHRTIRSIGEVLRELLPDEGDDEAQYYCAFDLMFGDQVTTIYMSQEEFDTQGLPDGASNIRILGS